MEEQLILKLGHAHFGGQLVVHWLVHVRVNVCTKYEVSTSCNSKDIKEVPKFRINGRFPDEPGLAGIY